MSVTQWRKALANAAASAAAAIGDVEPDLQRLVDIAVRDGRLSCEEIEEARAYEAVADARHAELDRAGADPQNWFSKARLAGALATAFCGAGWQDAADSAYDLCFAGDDNERTAELIRRHVDAVLNEPQ
jgi:hypothetical protein